MDIIYKRDEAQNALRTNVHEATPEGDELKDTVHGSVTDAGRNARQQADVRGKRSTDVGGIVTVGASGHFNDGPDIHLLRRLICCGDDTLLSNDFILIIGDIRDETCHRIRLTEYGVLLRFPDGNEEGRRNGVGGYTCLGTPECGHCRLFCVDIRRIVLSHRVGRSGEASLGRTSYGARDRDGHIDCHFLCGLDDARLMISCKALLA